MAVSASIGSLSFEQGDGPGTDPERWAALFSGAERVGQAKS